MSKNYQLVSSLLFILLSSHLMAQQIEQSFSKDHIIHDHYTERCALDDMHQKLMHDNPELKVEIEKYLNEGIPLLSSLPESNARMAPIITIPTVFHVVHNAGESVGQGANISDALVLNAMDILNTDFTYMNIDSTDLPVQWQGVSGNPQIEFCFASTDPNGDPSNGITRTPFNITGTSAQNSNIDSAVKPAVGWNSNFYLNIYIVSIPGTSNNGGVLGWAYFPSASIIGSTLDGIVADYRWVGGSNDETLTHEVGHYLGLPHTFSGNGCGGDDGIADTPNMANATSQSNPGLSCPNNNFPTGPNTCTEEHMYINYMDYVNDQRCYASFSDNQITVMRAVLNGTAGAFGYGSRLPMINNNNTVCTFFENDASLAEIEAPVIQLCGTDDFNPSVLLKNAGSNTLTSCMISYELNNGTPVDYAWIGNLPSGGTESVSLPVLSPPSGNFDLEFYVWMPNGGSDDQLSNDTLSISPTTVNKENLPFAESFEDGSFNPTNSGLFLINVQGDAFSWTSSGQSAFGVGSFSTVIDNYNTDARGTLDAIATPVYDFSNVSGASLSFDIAYAPYNGSFFDSLVVLVSTNCGSLYDQAIYLNGNTGMATAPATTAPFVPSASQWRTETVDLSAYDGFSDISIAFLNLAGYGNRIYLDNINVNAPNCKPIVTNVLNDGAGSLRKAVEDVCVGDSISFDPALQGQTINLTGQEIIIDKSMTISGLGMDQLNISGNGNSRIFRINSSAILYLADLKIINPGVNGSVLNEGTLNVKNVSIE
ncbi:MAG: M43 family zinc metalloprotease [Bacteroidota bacterium]